MNFLRIIRPALALISCCLQPTFVAGATLDQSFTSGDGLTGVINGCCAFVGQTYTAGTSGTLAGVSVDVHYLERQPAFDLPLDVQIRTVVNGLPTSTVLGETATRAFDLDDVIGFAQQIPQVPGEQYAIVVHFLEAPPQGNAVGAWIGALGPFVCGLPGLPPPGCAPNNVVPYPGGSAVSSFDGGTTWSVVPASPATSEIDFHFKTFVAAAVPEPTSLLLTGVGLIALLGFRRLASESGSTADTRAPAPGRPPTSVAATPYIQPAAASSSFR